MARRTQRCRDYSLGTLLRFFLLIILWVLYALVPHSLPLGTLWPVTALLVLHAWLVHRQGRDVMAGLVGLCAALNTLLIAYVSPGFNLFLTIAIFLILLFELATAPQRL